MTRMTRLTPTVAPARIASRLSGRVLNQTMHKTDKLNAMGIRNELYDDASRRRFGRNAIPLKE